MLCLLGKLCCLHSLQCSIYIGTQQWRHLKKQSHMAKTSTSALQPHLTPFTNPNSTIHAACCFFPSPLLPMTKSNHMMCCLHNLQCSIYKVFSQHGNKHLVLMSCPYPACLFNNIGLVMVDHVFWLYVCRPWLVPPLHCPQKLGSPCWSIVVMVVRTQNMQRWPRVAGLAVSLGCFVCVQDLVAG